MDIGSFVIHICLFIALYFEIFLMVAFLEKRPQKKSSDRPKRLPTITMVVPCFNEEKTLASTVNSLLALDYPSNKLHVIIVDDGSQDGTRGIGESLANQHKQVDFVRKENGGKYTALNLAIQRSNTELIGCLDADSFVAPDALMEIIKTFEKDRTICAVTPAMKVHSPKNLIELMQSVEYTFGIFYKKMFDNLAAVNVIPGPFSIYRREIFEKIGYFRHAHNTEDMEIAFRMHSHGLKISNAHTALVYTVVPPTVRELIKQRTRWSQGFLKNSQDYSHMYFNPRFGHFGLFALPFGIAGFFAGLFTAGYALYRIIKFISTSALDTWATKIPPHLPELQNINWLYINTNMNVFLLVVTLILILIAIILGSRISQSRLSTISILSYLALFGFLAPIWLARAAMGVVTARESRWR